MKNALGVVDSVVVLGGRSEIGRAIARRLVRDGASRVVLAVRGGAAADAAVELGELGATVTVVDFDALDVDSHERLVRSIFASLGDVDVVVSAVGELGDQARYEREPAAAAASVRTNLVGHVSTGLAVAACLRAQGHGTLVVLSSVAGIRTRRSNFVYGCAKAGLDGFALGLADALHGTGATAMAVRPGYVHTAMSARVPPAPMSVTVEDVADAVADGLRRGAVVVWVPQRLAGVFAVLRLLPRSVWRRMPT